MYQTPSACIQSLHKWAYLPNIILNHNKCVYQEQKIEQKVTGHKKSCTKNARGSTICQTIPVTRVVTLKPEILIPDLNLVLGKPVVLDPDGYTARNLDETYYLWDPVVIQHTPNLKWKNSRANTIHFEIIKNVDLHLEKEVVCKDNAL